MTLTVVRKSALAAAIQAERDAWVSNGASSATEAYKGLVELATAAELQNGAAGHIVPTAASLAAEITRRLTPESWIAPTLLNGWVNNDPPNTVAGYRKEPSGVVRLRGSVRSGTPGSAFPIFVLPSGYRPSGELFFVAENGTGSSTTIVVQASGNVYAVAGALTARLSFGNLTFAV